MTVKRLPGFRFDTKKDRMATLKRNAKGDLILRFLAGGRGGALRFELTLPRDLRGFGEAAQVFDAQRCVHALRNP
jgi:hypothetical protein